MNKDIVIANGYRGSRLLVPIIIIVYFSVIYIMRVIALGAGDTPVDALLVCFTLVCSGIAWMLDIR